MCRVILLLLSFQLRYLPCFVSNFMFQSKVTKCARLEMKSHEWLEQSTLRNVKFINRVQVKNGWRKLVCVFLNRQRAICWSSSTMFRPITVFQLYRKQRKIYLKIIEKRKNFIIPLLIRNEPLSRYLNLDKKANLLYSSLQSFRCVVGIKSGLGLSRAMPCLNVWDFSV